MSVKITRKAISGFTLVELSIVIVIIGFLVAGIAAGASMVKQAQLRSVMVDLQAYKSAYDTFNSAYNGVPGDITSASSFWANGLCASTADTDCNGNGDGLITVDKATPGDEVRPALKELSLAGMISSGIAIVPEPLVALTPGQNAATSKITGGGYFLAAAPTGGNISLTATVTSPFPTSVNAVYLGSAVAKDNLVNGALVPQDAFNIDQKMDDGSVSGGTFSGGITGSLMVMDAANVATVGAAGDCVTAASGVYLITTTYNACVVGFQLN